MVEVEIRSFDVVDGSRRIYIQPMFGESGSALSGAATMTRYWSPLSAAHRQVVGVLCWRRRS